MGEPCHASMLAAPRDMQGELYQEAACSCSHVGCDLGGGNIRTHLFLGFMIALEQFYTVTVL